MESHAHSWKMLQAAEAALAGQDAPIRVLPVLPGVPMLAHVVRDRNQRGGALMPFP